MRIGGISGYMFYADWRLGLVAYALPGAELHFKPLTVAFKVAAAILVQTPEDVGHIFLHARMVNGAQTPGMSYLVGREYFFGGRFRESCAFGYTPMFASEII